MKRKLAAVDEDRENRCSSCMDPGGGSAARERWTSDGKRACGDEQRPAAEQHNRTLLAIV
jgi:hypothetical protein